MAPDILITFTWQDLWFLRPHWLWGWIAVAIITILFIFSHRRREKWKQRFSRRLIPYLLIPGSKGRFRWPRVLLILVLSLMVLALAGPTWEEREHPGDRSEAALVILLDVSRSMLAEDIQPSRLERARMKVRDLFDAQPNIRTALVAFAGSAHSVVPFTKDYRAIDQLLEALNNRIMPVQGTHLPEAFDMADSLLKRVETPSFILLVTDHIREADLERIRLSALENRVEIMIIATPGGAPIPDGSGVMLDPTGEPVIAGFDPVMLEVLGGDPRIDAVPVTLDDSDVKILALNMQKNLEFKVDPEQAETEWKDFGYWILIPLLLLNLLWFRRGWLVHWIWIPLVVNGCVPDRENVVKGLFLTRDQQGRQLFEEGAYEEAAGRFESPGWKGMAYAEGGDLEMALEFFSREPSANGFYNQGVIYARMGDPEAAREAFLAALELDPGLDQARNNLGMVESTLDSLRSMETIETGGPENELRADQLEEPRDAYKEDEQAEQSDQTYQGRGDMTEEGSREMDENAVDFFDTGGEPASFDRDAARQSLMRQMEEDPSIFLRRKFAHQYRKRVQTRPTVTIEEDW